MATRGRPPHPDILTPRQWEVLDLVRQGLSNPEIAERLDITRAAVMFHVSEILGKLGLSSREEAAAWDPRQRPDWTPRWDPTRRPAWATALAPLGLFWRGLAGGLARSAGSLATLTSVGLGVALVAGITIFAVAVVRTRGSSNDASDTPPAVVGQSTATGKIAFYSDRDGHREIYVMNADGSGQTNLSNGPGDDYFGAWSPDGSRIAFTSNRDGNQEIYVVNADGSGLTNLTNGPGDDSFGAWSPDGSRIAFTSYDHIDLTPGPTVTPAAGNGDVYVVNANGSGLTNLTSGPGDDSFGAWSPDGSSISFTRSSASDVNSVEVYVVKTDGWNVSRLTTLANIPYGGGPAWSPDGSRIAFSPRNQGIYVMNADGSGLTRLTDTPGVELAWSPDGSRIAFTSGPGNSGDIYVMAADGSGQTRLTKNPGSDNFNAWSPDSSRIAFNSGRDGNWEIYVVNADGSGATNLTSNRGDDGGPAWSPDGTKIAFISTRDGNFEIYAMNADGSGQTNLTNNPGRDYDVGVVLPAWSPAP